MGGPMRPTAAARRLATAARRLATVTRRLAAVAGRCVMWLMPIGRGEWAEALWTEAGAAPPGRLRLAWRTGGLRLVTGEILAMRRVGRVLLFAAAAALMAWATQAITAGDRAAAVRPVGEFARIDVITTIELLAVLPVLSRRLFGPAKNHRAARLLRVGGYAAVMAVMPAKAAVEQFASVVPRNIHERRLYGAPPGGNPLYGTGEILFLVVLAVYVAALLWMTSRRSPVTPATMAIGAGSGALFGVVMYSVAPLGLNNYATNPWLPGSDVDPLVVLAWLLLLGGPVAAAILAARRHPGPPDTGPLGKTRLAQGIVAGLLANLSGALIVTVLGTGTTALMLHATWLRTLFDHGHQLNAVVVYSHEIDAAVNAPAYLLMCVAFPLIGMFMSVMTAAFAWGGMSEAGQGGPPGGGGPGQPGPVPGQPGGGREVEADAGVARLTAVPFPAQDGDDDAVPRGLVGAGIR